MFKLNIAVLILLAVVGVTQVSEAQIGAQCSDGLCVGQVALDKSNSYRQVQIVQIQNDGKYVLRLTDTGVLLRDRTRINLAFLTGCSDSLCVGLIALDKSNSYREVQIIAIQNDGKYVLRLFDTGVLLGDRTRINLAYKNGCSDNLCVGLIALDKSNSYRQVQIVAIQNDGKYVLQLLDSRVLLGDRTRINLAYVSGCSSNWCVGQTAYDKNNNYRQVRIHAIQNDGKLVIQFADNGVIQGDRTSNYLSLYPGSSNPPGSNRVVYGAGINTTTSPHNACRQRYGTQGLSVEVRNRIYACTYETCGHPSDWSRVFCQ